jgi:hypothetical protein
MPLRFASSVLTTTATASESELILSADVTNYTVGATTLTDSTGNGNTQTITAASYVDGGPLLGIRSFNCTADYDIQAVTPGPTLPTTGFTYLAWAKMNSSSADYRTLFRTEPNDHPLLIDIGTNTLGMWDTNGFNFNSTGYDVSAFADVWALWAVTGNSAGQTFYINGAQVGTTARSAAGNNHNRVGGIDANQSFGYVSNVRLYDGQLTQSQIETIYNEEVNGYRGLQISLDGFEYSGSGTNWPDNTGYGNNGTLVNAPTYSTTNMGLFDFNGSTQYVNLGSTQQPTRSQGFSFNVWVNFDSLTGWQTFVGQDTSQATSYGAFYFQKSNSGVTGDAGLPSNTAAMRILNTSGSLITCADTTTVTTGVWYNFTATVSSSEIKLYKNGALVTTVSNSDSMAPVTGDMIAGGGWYGDAVVDYLNGKIPIVQSYDRVLTADEISDLYDQYSYRYTAAQSGLYAQYLVEDYSGSTLTDSSGNSRNGSIVGATYNADGYFTLDGVNDYLVTDNMYGAISAADTHTVEMWVYANASNDCLWSDLGSTNNPATSGYHFAGAQIIQVGPFHQIITGLWNGTAITRDVGTSGSLTGSWRHVVRTYNGTTLTSYVNGANTSGGVTMSFDSPRDDGTSNWYLAFGAQDTTTYSGSTAGWLSGRVGIMRVYNRALSSAEVLANYNGAKAKYGL